MTTLHGFNQKQTLELEMKADFSHQETQDQSNITRDIMNASSFGLEMDIILDIQVEWHLTVIISLLKGKEYLVQ